MVDAVDYMLRGCRGGYVRTKEGGIDGWRRGWGAWRVLWNGVSVDGGAAVVLQMSGRDRARCFMGYAVNGSHRLVGADVLA